MVPGILISVLDELFDALSIGVIMRQLSNVGKSTAWLKYDVNDVIHKHVKIRMMMP